MSNTNTAVQYDHNFFSDLHKEAFGTRPTRHLVIDLDLDQWEIDDYFEYLHRIISSNNDEYEHEHAHREEEARWEAFMAPADPCVHDIYDVV